MAVSGGTSPELVFDLVEVCFIPTGNFEVDRAVIPDRDRGYRIIHHHLRTGRLRLCAHPVPAEPLVFVFVSADQRVSENGLVRCHRGAFFSRSVL